MYITKENLFLHSDSPRRPYDPKIKNINNTTHYGQLKLFCTSLYFIINYVKGRDPKIIIPGGGSYSVNNGILADLFPQYNFFIIDPIEPSFGKKDNVIYIKSLFTDEMVEYWSKQKNVYLISDIRRTSLESTMGKELDVHLDNLLQKDWVELIKPEYSFLKFRIPYDYVDVGKKYKYLDGDILFQTFQKDDSNETRLVVPKDYKIKNYDSVKYEQQMFYHNTVTRKEKFMDCPRLSYLGLYNDYDSSYVCFVCYSFLKKFGYKEVPLEKFIENVLKRLSPKKSLNARRGNKKN